MSDAAEEAGLEPDDAPFWRLLPSQGRPNRVGKYGIDLGERGIYDTRNKLNELTGREWVYFTNSVWVTAYPPTAGKDTAFDLRKIHPSPKPPELMRDIIHFFTKHSQLVLDPFAGVGGTMLGAELCNPPRRAVGIELNPPSVQAFGRVSQSLGLKHQQLFEGDARDWLLKEPVSAKTYDMILTDPPYSDMMVREKNGQKLKLYGRKDPTPFSGDDRDIGNLDYESYLSELKVILSLASDLLKPKGYMVVFCKDLQPKEDSPNLIHADVVNELNQVHQLRYRGMRIWHDQATDLYPFGYPFAFVMNQMHHYILVFRKEPKS